MKPGEPTGTVDGYTPDQKMELSVKSLRLLAVGVLASALSVLLSPAGPAGAQNVRLCGGMPVTILGTDGDDVLGGTDGPDVIAGLQGNDVLLGFGGDDIICGGLGNDIVAGGPGFDILEGSQGNDVLWANGQSINNANKIEDTRGARMTTAKKSVVNLSIRQMLSQVTAGRRDNRSGCSSAGFEPVNARRRTATSKQAWLAAWESEF